MREGTKIVVVILLLMMLAFAVIFITSERLFGLNKMGEMKEGEVRDDLTTCKILFGSEAHKVRNKSADTCKDTCTKNRQPKQKDLCGGETTDVPTSLEPYCCCQCPT
ncbi:MAG: hypothetical protein B6U87_00100 [Candidatus Aenigmarchaeota archaeon ex4484_52]|nr:MAG: hypothetical protein B6U87_00100 [Candidatus Aenigmarchaeota archaeon ex4484_52]